MHDWIHDNGIDKPADKAIMTKVWLNNRYALSSTDRVQVEPKPQSAAQYDGSSDLKTHNPLPIGDVPKPH